jgi:hypothetical protein
MKKLTEMYPVSNENELFKLIQNAVKNHGSAGGAIAEMQKYHLPSNDMVVSCFAFGQIYGSDEALRKMVLDEKNGLAVISKLVRL